MHSEKRTYTHEELRLALLESENKVIVDYPIHIEVEVALLKQSISNINQTLIRLETKIDKGFDKIDERFDQVDQKFDAIDKRFDKLENEIKADFKDIRKEMSSNFHWLIGSIGALALSTIGTLITMIFKLH